MSSKSRTFRIAGASGSSSDRRFAIADLAKNFPNDPVDVIVGDWLSEANMTKSAGRLTTGNGFAYEPSFLEALRPALRDLSKYKIKVAVNAGASNTERLFQAVLKLLRQERVSLKVAWIEGDSVLDIVKAAQGTGAEFRNIYTGEKLESWRFKPIYAHAYLGGMGIATAFEKGADIVICGRVSDASLVTGAAVWWHSWSRENLQELANALVAGHLIECSTYVCGGNFTGFQSLPSDMLRSIGYPIAEISAAGDVLITKQQGAGGVVTAQTCTSQLLYEIQGPWYFNSDVTAVIDNITFDDLGGDRVAVGGVGFLPPPRTTKVGLTANGGFQAEIHYYIVGLEVEAKAQLLKEQILHLLSPHIDRFTLLDFSLNGTAQPDADTQNAATVDFRILAQADSQADLKPALFARPVTDCIMQSYPGATFHLDLRTAVPKPIYEYHVTLLPQCDTQHLVHLDSGESFDIPAPADDGKESVVFPAQQPSQPQTAAASLPPSLSETTVRGPLGCIAHARSGDKGSNANVGFWVKRREQYDWLRTVLSVDAIKVLLGREYNGKQIDRMELPNIYAVHFLLHDHLDRGVSCTKKYDVLAKNLAEYLRARHVDLPVQFLHRGQL